LEAQATRRKGEGETLDNSPDSFLKQTDHIGNPKILLHGYVDAFPCKVPKRAKKPTRTVMESPTTSDLENLSTY
jgi:hypothetical protein